MCTYIKFLTLISVNLLILVYYPEISVILDVLSFHLFYTQTIGINDFFSNYDSF